MEKKSKPWVLSSLALVAEFFEVPLGTVKSWRTAGMPGSPKRWDLREIIDWKESRPGPGRPSIVVDDDPMLAEGESEALERFRMARAQQEEIKLAEKRGQVVLMDRFMDCVRVALSPLRKVQETFKRRGDRESLQLLHEAIDEMERGLEQLEVE